MKRRSIVFAAVVLMACLIAGALILQQRWPVAGGVTARSLGPSGETFTFASDPAGRGGPASDCIVCHSVQKGESVRSAPSLVGIFGAPKAHASWFAYSLPLRQKGGVWSEDDLDKYLADPSAFVPGTLKTLPPITDPVRRREVIAFLKTLKG